MNPTSKLTKRLQHLKANTFYYMCYVKLEERCLASKYLIVCMRSPRRAHISSEQDASDIMHVPTWLAKHKTRLDWTNCMCD